MLFKDYLEKCLEDEEFKKEWEKQHKEEEIRYIELMNKFMEIVEGNVKPTIYKVKPQGWKNLYKKMKKEYKIINYDEFGYPITYYFINENDVLFLIYKSDHDCFYLEYKNNKLEFIHSKNEKQVDDNVFVSGTYCVFAYNLNNDLVILTSNDIYNPYFYYLVFGKEDIKETKIVKKVNFDLEIKELYYDDKFYFENHWEEFVKIGKIIGKHLMKKDINSIKKYFSKDIVYMDTKNYYLSNNDLTIIFKILLDSKKILDFWMYDYIDGIGINFKIKEKDNRIRKTCYFFDIKRNYICTYVQRVQPEFCDLKEYE